MFERVLIAVDFSECAVAALEVARREFPQASRKLLYVLDINETKTSEALQDALLGGHHREDAALQASHELEAQCWPGEVADAVVGLPAEEILACSRTWNADLIVMGTQGRRGLSHLVFGSVAEAVVRTSAIPVLTVRQVKAKGEPRLGT